MENSLLRFSDKEKIQAFDRIATCFYQQNYGTASKSDIELIFFSTILEHLRYHHLPFDDYAISNILGITQQRVRNLKVKCQLRNLYTIDWKKEFAYAVQARSYSENDRFVIISISNPVLQIEIQHFIESNGGFVDFALNPKLLKMPTRDFARLMVEIGCQKSEESVLCELRKMHIDETDLSQFVTKERTLDAIKNCSLEMLKDIITNTAASVLSSCIVPSR